MHTQLEVFYSGSTYCCTYFTI